MYLHGNYYSEVMGRSLSFRVILPSKFHNIHKQMILLNGRGSDENVWSFNAPLEELADKYNIAFFCPNGENSFYTNHADGENYATAIGKEFPEKMKEIFRFKFEYENTEIAGFSMGGYGAVLLGLRFHQFYSRIGAFSPAFVFYKKNRCDLMYQHVFSKGDFNSENDVLYWYKKLTKKGKKIPHIFFSCGNQDPLFEQTKYIENEIKKINTKSKVKFLKQKGFHDFSLWRPALIEFLKVDD